MGSLFIGGPLAKKDHHMQHRIRTYRAEDATKIAEEDGDFSSDPKHLKREILFLRRRVNELEKSLANKSE